MANETAAVSDLDRDAARCRLAEIGAKLNPPDIDALWDEAIELWAGLGLNRETGAELTGVSYNTFKKRAAERGYPPRPKRTNGATG